MPQPTRTQVHVDAVLSNVSVAYMNRQTNYIASRVFPAIPVDKQSDLYFKYNKNDWFRDEAKVRAGGTESAGGGYNISTDSYIAQVYAFHKDIDDQIRRNADAGINLDRDATEFVTQRLLLRMERAWQQRFFAAGIWANNLTGVASTTPSAGQFTQWSDYLNSDPVGDIQVGKELILKNTGFGANTLVVGYQVWQKLQHHPDVRDRYKYTSADNITPELVARLFELDRILVAQAVYSGSDEGAASPTYDFLFGKGALLVYSAPSPSLLQPSAGYTFLWRGISGSVGSPLSMSRFRMEHLKSDRVEGEVAFDHKVVADDLGVYFATAVA